MKKVLLLLACVACNDSITSNKENSPQLTLVPTFADSVYCVPDGIPQKFDYYKGNQSKRKDRLVIGIHGGAWKTPQNGNDPKDNSILLYEAQKFTAEGMDFASIGYRTWSVAAPNMFPKHLQDAFCAVRYFRTHAEQYDIDPEKIGVFGFSAGGHIAAMMAVATDSLYRTSEWDGVSSIPFAVVTYSAPTALYESSEFPSDINQHIEDVFGDMKVQASPVTWVSSNDVVIRVVHGEEDLSVDKNQAVLLDSLLTFHDVLHEFLMITCGGHYITAYAGTGCVIIPTRLNIRLQTTNFFLQKLQ